MCVLNAILWITITGARWRDLPKTEAFASKSSAHRWLLRWQIDGPWQKILETLIQIALRKKLIDSDRFLEMRVFFPSRMGGSEVENGYKEKGSTIHLLTDGNGQPIAAKVTSANADERKQVIYFLRAIPRKGAPTLLEADKGYDSRELRVAVLNNRIYPLIPFRISISSWVKRVRWKVERCISCLKRSYRRLTTRWELLSEVYAGVLLQALSYHWVKKIVDSLIV